MHGEIKRVKKRVVNIEDGSLTYLVNRIIDPLDHLLRLLIVVVRKEGVLDLSQKGNNFLCWSLKEICVVKGFYFLLGRFRKFDLEDVT